MRVDYLAWSVAAGTPVVVVAEEVGDREAAAAVVGEVNEGGGGVRVRLID